MRVPACSVGMTIDGRRRACERQSCAGSRLLEAKVAQSAADAAVEGVPHDPARSRAGRRRAIGIGSLSPDRERYQRRGRLGSASRFDCDQVVVTHGEAELQVDLIHAFGDRRNGQ
jgi:hypothetical protein